MRKDIFIDNNVAKNFANPLDNEYKRLIKWLLRYDPNKLDRNAWLATSNKLIGEYNRSTGSSYSATNIGLIVDKLTKEGRHNKITNKQIKDFKRVHFKKHVVKKLRSSQNDRDLIPVVMLSDRKLALALDRGFCWDVVNFPGFSARAARRPQNLPYDQ